MAAETPEGTHHHRHYGSARIVRNEHNRCSRPGYPCKDEGAYGVLSAKVRYSEEEKERILRA